MDLTYVKDAAGKGRGVYTKQPIKKGEFVIEFVGVRIPLSEASVMSLQVDSDIAIESTGEIDDYLNHSCSPNCFVKYTDERVDLYALRDLELDEEVTFNYNTTEWDMVTQGCSFDCQCGSPYCIGKIQGFKHLNTKQMLDVQKLLVPYLAKWLFSATLVNGSVSGGF